MLNISLPDSLEAAIAQQAEQAGFDTSIDYLVRLGVERPRSPTSTGKD
jgi:hypothetical protein